MDKQPPEVCSCAYEGEDGLDLDPPLWWWPGYIYNGLGPIPKMKAAKDPTMAEFEGRQLVHLILTKGGLRLQSFWP